jgi:transposase
MTIIDPRTNGPPSVGRRNTETQDDLHLHALAHAVAVAVRQVDQRMLAGVGGSENNVAFEPRTLLAILTFCYAREIYGSAEVAARLRRDENLRRLCADDTPDPNTLRRFRIRNRLALNFCLKAALRFLAEEKIAQGLLTKVSEEHVAEEASRRVISAMFTDSLELDKDRSCGGPAYPTIELCLSVAKRATAVH